MKTVTREFVSRLIDFAPKDGVLPPALGRTQTEGTVAAFNMLVRNRCAYLADEVGMGKTFVALGVMGLFRYFNPKARVMIIAPRENIQLKWQKELTNFVRNNWRHIDNRVKSLQDGPDWQPVVCSSLHHFIRESLTHPDRDFLLRMTSFSLRLAKEDDRQSLRDRLRKEMRWLPSGALKAKTADSFRDAFGAALNAVVPPIDLLIVDEAHNLKHGFGENTSIRNRVLGFAFGHPSGKSADERPWYRPNLARRVLFLSATPFEDDYGAIQRQLEIFGFGNTSVTDIAGRDGRSVAELADPKIPDDEKREIVRRLMVRRVSGLDIGGKYYTKNMYRREWRQGGCERHDEPMLLEDVEQRLVVALMQKKVAEVLQDDRFNNQFQIGMLSSFESFLETVKSTRRMPDTIRANDEEDEGVDAVFHGDQAERYDERHGIDTEAISAIVESFRSRFRKSLPHPKLDATARSFDKAFDTGEKSLVFVRRIRTVDELAGKLDAICDSWIRRRMEEALPGLQSEIAKLFDRYERERSRRPEERLEELPIETQEREPEDLLSERNYLDSGDEGSAETFFAWFFRGKGPRGYLSGAAFQKNRLASASSAYATLFEDDYVAWLLDNAGRPLEALAAVSKRALDPLLEILRRSAYGHFSRLSKQKDGYPRQYVLEAYQIAGLEVLSEAGGELGARASIVLQERYPSSVATHQRAPAGFPGPEDAIGVTTFFTELAKRTQLRERLWPVEDSGDFRKTFRRREQRRELLSGMARLGASYIDLYLLAIRSLGSFQLKGESESGSPNELLAREFVDLLESQSRAAGFHAFYELSCAAENFDLILAVNFPEIPAKRLDEIAAIYGATLQRQVPVGRMWGGVNRRLVRQFRMPGFPIALITTDVLQEGEDLHTFCRRVSHYGITWTASGMEQRTGRIDRIGSLVQRNLHGAAGNPSSDDFIQVFYPHLRDTVEVLQVRRVLKRLNRFFRLIHEHSAGIEDKTSRIDAAREMLEDLGEIQQFTEPLKSAFPADKWLDGELKEGPAAPATFEEHYRHFEVVWRELLTHAPIVEDEAGSKRIKRGVFSVEDGAIGIGNARAIAFQMELRSQTSGQETLLRCTAAAGQADLVGNDELLDKVYELQQKLGAKVCTRRNERLRVDEISIEGDILFDPATTQFVEVAALSSRTAIAAASLTDILEGPRPKHEELVEVTLIAT